MSGKGKSLVAGVVLVVSVAVPAASAQAAPQPRDVTGDGYADVLGKDESGRLTLFPNNRTDAPWSWSDREFVGTDFNYIDAMLFADVNLDGLDDLLVRQPDRNGGLLWAVQRDQDDTTWTTRIYCGEGWNGAVSLLAEDVTGDGRDDLVLREPGGLLYLYPHTGDTGQLPYRDRQLIGSNWQDVDQLRIADVTGDDHPDLVARDADGFLWIYPHSADVLSTQDAWTFGSRDATPYPAGAGWERYDTVFLTDVTGDGRVDAVGRDTAGELWVYPHNGAPEGKNPWPDRVAAGDWWSQYQYLIG